MYALGGIMFLLLVWVPFQSLYITPTVAKMVKNQELSFEAANLVAMYVGVAPLLIIGVAMGIEFLVQRRKHLGP